MFIGLLYAELFCWNAIIGRFTLDFILRGVRLPITLIGTIFNDNMRLL